MNNKNVIDKLMKTNKKKIDILLLPIISITYVYAILIACKKMKIKQFV